MGGVSRQSAFWLCLVAVMLGGLRIAGEKGLILQWAAHSFVTWMFVAWRYEGGRLVQFSANAYDWVLDLIGGPFVFYNTGKPFYFYLFVGLSVLELVCFFMLKR